MLLSEGGMGCDPWASGGHFRSSWKGFGTEVLRSFTFAEVLFATFMDSIELEATTGLNYPKAYLVLCSPKNSNRVV